MINKPLVLVIVERLYKMLWPAIVMSSGIVMMMFMFIIFPLLTTYMDNATWLSHNTRQYVPIIFLLFSMFWSIRVMYLGVKLAR